MKWSRQSWKVEALGTPLVEVKEDVLSKAKNGSPEFWKGLGTPLVEVKEDVLSKAKNGSPERLRLWVRPS
jgi:hypothetical protein